MYFVIEKKPGEYVKGKQIKTKGNDDEYPTFLLEDGTYFGVHKSRVAPIFEDEEK